MYKLFQRKIVSNGDKKKTLNGVLTQKGNKYSKKKESNREKIPACLKNMLIGKIKTKMNFLKTEIFLDKKISFQGVGWDLIMALKLPT
jgi:hypothetical protein